MLLAARRVCARAARRPRLSLAYGRLAPKRPDHSNLDGEMLNCNWVEAPPASQGTPTGESNGSEPTLRETSGPDAAYFSPGGRLAEGPEGLVA